MSYIIVAAVQATYSAAVDILAHASTLVGQSVPVVTEHLLDPAEQLVSKVNDSHDTRIISQQRLNRAICLYGSTERFKQGFERRSVFSWPVPSSHVRVTPDILPWDNFVVSRDEILYNVPLTFCDRKLPSPDEVRAASSPFLGKPHVVPFPALGIVVKFGPRPGLTSDTGAICFPFTSISEAQSLYAVPRMLGQRVPVPKVYAFVHDGDQSFLYMELVQGVTLLECWADLSDKAKIAVCAQLKPMMEALRELEQDPSDTFIGTISRQPPQDVMFQGRKNPGPFTSITAFHDYLSNPRNMSSSPHPFRSMLRDNQQIYFTHCDINRANIIVSPPSDGLVHIRAIIDWQQSGWYPANWEYCKARWQTSDSDLGGWEQHLSEFLERWPTRWFWEWDYFTMSFL